MFKGVVSDLGRPFAARTRGLCSQTSQSAAVISDEGDTSPPKLLSAKPAPVAVALTDCVATERVKGQAFSVLGGAFVFATPGELLFGDHDGFTHALRPSLSAGVWVTGSILIYYFRLLERQMGSAKFSVSRHVEYCGGEFSTLVTSFLVSWTVRRAHALPPW